MFFFWSRYLIILSYLSSCPIYVQAHWQPKEMWLIYLPILCLLASFFLGLSFLYFYISIPSLSLLLVFWAMETMMTWTFQERRKPYKDCTMELFGGWTDTKVAIVFGCSQLMTLVNTTGSGLVDRCSNPRARFWFPWNVPKLLDWLNA